MSEALLRVGVLGLVFGLSVLAVPAAGIGVVSRSSSAHPAAAHPPAVVNGRAIAVGRDDERVYGRIITGNPKFNPKAAKLRYYVEFAWFGGPQPVIWTTDWIRVEAKAKISPGTYRVSVRQDGLPSCASFEFDFVARDRHGTTAANPGGSFTTPCPRRYIVWSIGQNYHGAAGNSPFDASIDTRTEAKTFGKALAGMGYIDHNELNGQPAKDVLEEAGSSAVVAIFDHANAGIVVTGGSGTSFCQQRGITGWPKSGTYCHGRWWSLGSLVPHDLWRVRLVIFAGCNTADTGGRYYRNLMGAAAQWGAQAVIGFRGLIRSPAPGYATPHQRDDYFWARFSHYLRSGFKLRKAWHRALGDMTHADGRTDGFQTMSFGGAASNPGDMRMTISGPHASAASDQDSQRDRLGDLVEYDAAPSASGDVSLSAAQAQAVATRFLAANAPRIYTQGLHVVSRQATSHQAGERLESFTYRSRVGGISGPALALVEVDLRTSRVVFETAAAVKPSATSFLVSRRRARAIVAAASGEQNPIVSITRDIWTVPRWTVTVRRAGGALEELEINATTGRITNIGEADPVT